MKLNDGIELSHSMCLC